jgi:hypothetical protein
VEFALSFVDAGMGLLFAVFNWMLAMYVYHTMILCGAASHALRNRARLHLEQARDRHLAGTSAPPNFTVPYNCTATAADIQNYVQSLASPGVVPSGLTINTATSYVWPGTTPACTSRCRGSYVERVVFDELAALFDVFAHERGEDLVRFRQCLRA